jgi:tetratricopeptide (TPR) repeat protein
MRRGSPIKTWCVGLLVLSATAGCTWPGTRRDRPQAPPTPEQAARAQQLSERAQESIDRGDLEQAKVELLQLVAETPRSAEAHQRLGKVLKLQGRLNEAETCFRRALELDPDYVGALIGLGNIEAARGDLASALRRYDMAVEIEPHDAEAHFAQAQVLEAMNRTDPALAAYFRTLEFNPLHRQASVRIGAIQLARDQPDQALARLEQAVDLSPEDGEVRLLRGRAYLALRHFPEAVADFRAAARHLASRPDVYYQLALALEAANRPDDALKAAEQALRLAPDYADARDLTRKLRR